MPGPVPQLCFKLQAGSGLSHLSLIVYRSAEGIDCPAHGLCKADAEALRGVGVNMQCLMG